MRNETKLVLIFVIASALLGFTQIPIQSAYAGTVGKSCENVEHWNKIIFISDEVTWSHDNQPDINPTERHEVIVQVDPDTSPSLNKLVSDKLNEIGYTNAANGDTPEPENFVSFDGKYSSFCLDENDFMQVVGGMLLQPDSATLLIAYGIANSIWIVPSVAGIGIAVYLVKRKF